MCARVLHVCVLLWVGGGVVSAARGKVVALANMTVEAGLPMALRCNITMATGDILRQVRWVDPRGALLLSYMQRVPISVSHQAPGVVLTASPAGASAIIVERVRPDDEGGCYRCLFDVFPTGTHEGATCLTVPGRVHLQGNKTVVSGQPTALSCSYSLPDRVRQVLWSKTTEQGDSTVVASYSKHGHHDVSEKLRARVDLSRSLGDTRLSVRPVWTEDEACYTCEFNTFPDGTKSATACLSVQVLPKPQVTQVTLPSGVTEANCTARSRPAADIAWDLCGDNRTLGPPTSWASEHGDGTTTVTSSLTFPSALLAEVALACVVSHPGLSTPVTLPLRSKMSRAMVVLLSVCGVLSVLLLCLCVCLCKCFICTDD